MSAIAPEMEAAISARLDSVEQEHQVRILFAVESGSRAWGFASPDSDYDIRFIYVHPRDWYLSIAPGDQPDVIEYPITDLIELNGWELRKALRLFRNSNPTFVEWIQSPMRYRQTGSFTNRIHQLLPDLYSCDKGIQHYRSMAHSHYRK